MNKKRSFLFLGAVSIAAFMWGRVPPQQNVAQASGGEAAAPVSDAPALMKIEPIVVNLNDEDETHYLKCAIELQLATPKDADAITPRMGIVRNELILHLSSLTFPDTRGEKPKVELLETIASRLNHAIGGERIKKAYFTDFVVQ